MALLALGMAALAIRLWRVFADNDGHLSFTLALAGEKRAANAALLLTRHVSGGVARWRSTWATELQTAWTRPSPCRPAKRNASREQAAPALLGYAGTAI